MAMATDHHMAEMQTELPCVEADAYSFLRTRETQQPAQFDATCPNAVARPKTLETMFQIAHKLSLGWTTRAAAVSYFDRVLQDLRDMPMNALPLLAMGSLLIAAKMEEEEINVPTVSSLLDAAESNASMQELNVMELLILKIWGWNACVVTPMHFVPFYSRVARVYDEERDLSQFQTSYNLRPERGSVDEVVNDPVAQLACCLAEGSLLDNSIGKYLPSVVAAASIALARMQFDIEPHWPHTLSAVSGHAVADGAPPIIVECCTHMLSICKAPMPPVLHQPPKLTAEELAWQYHQQHLHQQQAQAQASQIPQHMASLQMPGVEYQHKPHPGSQAMNPPSHIQQMHFGPASGPYGGQQRR